MILGRPGDSILLIPKLLAGVQVRGGTVLSLRIFVISISFIYVTGLNKQDTWGMAKNQP